MQSMPGMLSKLENDFQQRAKAIDPWLSVSEVAVSLKEIRQDIQLSISLNLFILFHLIQSSLVLLNLIQSYLFVSV